jgi:hypothetical protein
MKVIPSTEKTYKGKKLVPPPIPVSKPVVPELKKQESLVMKLHSNPSNADSQTDDLIVKYFAQKHQKNC